MAELSEEDGILQKLSREGDKYLFLHRTFQEYFTASYLQRNRDCIALAKEHFWEYDWHETLSLLAGLMDNPILLIRAITDEKDDIFWTLLLLAGRCVAECREISDELVVGIIDRIYDLWESYLHYDFIELIVVPLGQVNSQMFQRLHTALNDSNKFVRWRVPYILGEIGNAQAVEALIDALNDSDDHVRWEVAEALGKIGVQAVWALITVLNHSDEDVRLRAALILDRMIISLYYLSHLNHSDEDVRRENVKAVAEISAQAVGSLIAVLNHSDKDERMWAALTLYRMIIWLNALNHSDKDVEAVAEISAQVVKVLITVLNDSDKDERLRAAATLYMMIYMTIISLQFLNHSDKDVRREDVEAVAEIGNAQEVEALITALKDLDKDVRMDAAWALGENGDAQAVEALITALNDSDYDVRREAAEALAKIGTSETLAKLIQLPEIDIYNPDIFLLARKLAIRFSRDKLPFIPVYPELVAHKQ
jgi:HEAT repeat protein